MSLTRVSYSMISGAYINVLDFGADNTGVADSTSAIQAAIDSISGDGNTVFMPAGVYLVSGPIKWPVAKNLILVGAGSSGAGNGTTQKASTQINFSGSDACLEMHGLSWDANQVGGGVKDLYIVNTGSVGNTIGVDILWASGSAGRLILENVFTLNFNVGFKLSAVLESVFINCQARGGNTGWYLYSYPEAVNSNVFIGCASDSSVTGVIIAEGSGGNVWFGGTIQGNIIGAYFTGGTFGPTSNGFIGTWFEGQATGQGIVFDKQVGATYATSNFIENCYFSTWGTGIQLTNAKNTRIKGNKFVDMGGIKTPIIVGPDATNTLIEDNYNSTGNNDYNFASAGAGTIWREFNANYLASNVVGSSGSLAFKSNNELLLMQNLTNGTVYFDWNTGTSNPRLDVANGAQIVGYSDNFSTPTFKLGNTVRVPSYTTTQRDALFAITNGDLIYNTTTNKFQGYQNGSWVDLA